MNHESKGRLDAVDGKLIVDFNEEHDKLEFVGGRKLMEMQSSYRRFGVFDVNQS